MSSIISLEENVKRYWFSCICLTTTSFNHFALIKIFSSTPKDKKDYCWWFSSPSKLHILLLQWSVLPSNLVSLSGCSSFHIWTFVVIYLIIRHPASLLYYVVLFYPCESSDFSFSCQEPFVVCIALSASSLDEYLTKRSWFSTYFSASSGQKCRWLCHDCYIIF